MLLKDFYQGCHSLFTKTTLRVMKLTAIFLLAAAMEVSASGFGQEITLNLKNAPLEKVFTEIERQTGYQFFYKTSVVAAFKNMDVHVTRADMQQALDQILKIRGLNYNVIGKIIVITPKESSRSGENAPPPVEIHGSVLSESGELMAGVTVMIKGTQQAVTTNDAGEFNIKSEKDIHSLIFSYVGYESREIEVKGRSNLRVVLRLSSSAGLGNVVVTALGITKRSKALSYSVQEVGGNDVNEVKSGNVMNSLDGKISGLQIAQSSSGPGGATRILLRGNRSIQGSNNALVVVDGVAIDNSLPEGPVTTDGQINSLDGAANINPDDIQSVTVLKGASAAALYGSRAANGVIMINTKKGHSGRMQIDVNSGIATEKIMMLPKLQNTYGQGAGGLTSTEAVGSWGPSGVTTYPDNISDMFQAGLNVTNAVGVTVGQDKVQGYFSYTNDYMKGVVPRNALSRNTLNLRLTANPIKNLSTDLKIAYVNQDVANIFGGGEGSPLGLIYRAPRSVSTEQMRDFADTVDGREHHKYWISSSLYTNPYWAIYRQTRDVSRNRLMLLGSAKYQFTNWLNLQFRYSLDRYTDDQTSKVADGSPNVSFGGNYGQNEYNVMERNMDLLLSGDNKISSSFRVSYNLGGSLLDRSFGSNLLTAAGLQVPNKFNINFATSLTATNNFMKSQLQSMYATATVAFKEYLFLDATARNDWSSTLPSPYSYFYPSVGLSAVLSDALKLPEAISFAKLRLSYSRVGNDAQPYLLNPVYNFSQGGTAGFIVRSSSQPIPDLKPEKTTSLEGGLDIRFFSDRLGLDLTYYKTNSSNQLLSLAVSPVSGYQSKYLNAGNIQNSGWEVTLRGNPVRGAKFNWDVFLNYARNRNKVISLSDDVKESILLSGFMHLGTVKVAEGGSYGDLYAYGWAKNDKGQYIVNDLGLPVQSPLKKVGNYNPDYTIGLGNNFSYGNWVASVLISGRVGGEVLSASESIMSQLGNTEYTAAHREDGWILDAVKADGSKNATAITSEQFWNAIGGNYAWGEFFTYDATTFRVREFTLGYRFNMPERGFVKALKLSFVARNLFFLYRGSATMDIPGIGRRKLNIDPEIAGGTSNLQGIEFINLPPTRTLGLNLKVSF
jgi:TonB-linked SusC/RagA family outer membrane protein